MELKINKNSCVVFDLDDTLYDEFDYLLSGFRFVAQRFCPEDELIAHDLLLDAYKKGKNAFRTLIDHYQLEEKGVEVDEILNCYRSHKPILKFRECAYNFIALLKEMNIKTGIITDGRAVTQRSKLESLGILDKMDYVLISEEFGSEKPAQKNYEAFYERFGKRQYVYIGDNTEKDFVSPNLLGWGSICIKDSGRNIHKQNFNLPHRYLPQFTTQSFCEIELSFK